MCTEAALNNIWIILDQFTCCMGLQKTCFMGHGVIIYICYNIYMLHGVIIYRARQVWMKIKFKARTDIVITEKAFFLIITLINQEVWRLTQFRPALPLPPPPPLPFFFRVGEISFDYLPWREGGIWKIKKRGESMVQGEVFLKGVLTLFPI